MAINNGFRSLMASMNAFTSNDNLEVSNVIQNEFRLVLLVVSFEGASLNVVVNVDSSLEVVKVEVCQKWSSLSPSLFDLVFVREGKEKKVESDFDLQALVCYLIKKSFQFVNMSVLMKHLAPVVPACASSSSDISSSSSICNSKEVENLAEYVCQVKVPILTGVGQTFIGGASEFRIQLLKHCLLNGYDLVLVKNEPGRVTAECVHKDTCSCGWRVHASKKHKLGDALVIKSFVSEHSCGAGLKHVEQPVMSSKLVMHVVKDMVKDRPMMKPSEIISYFQRQFGVELSYYFAYRGRKRALEKIHGGDELSYHQLEWYIDNLKATNPGSHCVLEKHPESRKFQRLFISYGASQYGFSFCKPVVFCDATFLKGKFKGVLLAANGKNGNQGIFQIAMAIVSSENVENWVWFMENLKMCLSDQRTLTFISDRHRGLLVSIATVFPDCYHSFCFYHLKKNLLAVIPKKHPDRDKLVGYFHDICHSYTHEEYLEAVERFKSVGFERAIKFLDTLPIINWTNAHFIGCRYGDTSSALAESFNSWIEVERNLPITALLDTFRMRVMTMANNRRQASQLWRTRLCPQWEAEVESRIESGKSWPVVKSSESVFEIIADRHHRVDLSQSKCSCNAWQVDSFPCAHVIRCINADRRQVYDFCKPFFFSCVYREAYSKSIEPLPTHGMPTSIGDYAAVLPPDVLKQPGRPRKNRIGKYRSSKRKGDTVRYKAYGRHSGKKASVQPLPNSTHVFSVESGNGYDDSSEDGGNSFDDSSFEGGEDSASGIVDNFVGSSEMFVGHKGFDNGSEMMSLFSC